MEFRAPPVGYRQQSDMPGLDGRVGRSLHKAPAGVELQLLLYLTWLGLLVPLQLHDAARTHTM